MARSRVRAAAMAAALVGLVVGCTGGGSEGRGSEPAPGGSASGTSGPVTLGPLTPADWPTYHHDNARTGVAPGFPPARSLSVAWRAKLDGAVYGQPLVVGTTVFAATERDSVYALDAGTGRVVWSAHLGTPVPLDDLPCGNIDPLGITSTMVYDPGSRSLFALAELAGGRHELVTLDAASGAVTRRRALEPPRGDRLAHQQRGALNLLDGWVYVSYGGLAGDCGQYIGSVVAAPTTGDAPARSYAIPTSREGGIWAPGGAAVSGGRLLYAVGNGESTSSYDGSDSVVALTPALTLADRFAPTTWAEDNGADLDLGSMSPVVVGSSVYAVGKRGVGYVLRADRLGGIGGEVVQRDVCRAFGGAAVAGTTVYLPCADGTRAVEVTAGTAPVVRWHASAGAGSPVVGGGAVWVVDYDGGVLSLLDPDNGAVRSRVSIGRAPHFCSPTLARGRAFVGTDAGVVAVNAA